MEIDEYFKYRINILEDSKDDHGFISEPSFLNSVLPSMVDAKLIDSEDYNESFYIYQLDKIKINGYSVNESGERLQLYIVNEASINLNINESELKITLKSYYEEQFNRVIKFVKTCHGGTLNNDIQDADEINVLVTQISSAEGIDQFDVIEIFLISATATIESRGASPSPKKIEFDNDKIKISYTKNREKITKEIIVIKKLIDLNFLYTILVSQGNREPLTVDFDKLFNVKIEAIKAADEEYFESYLCVLSGDIIADLYKEFSSRMLEKNVRSFLQFPKKGVNSGIKDTIIDEPEKFIAYNNGLTITSTGKEINEIDGKIYIKSLTDFQIVNGGQTTATIYFTQKDGISVSKVKVMAKINVAKQSSEEELDKLITNISTFSNAQSRVSKVDLRARSIQLVKIKALSDSVVTPNGLKWFFERAKGELNTIILKDKKNRDKILKKYPKERRFTKEELAKYYTFWDNKPYLVKLGGEKVFRSFIEDLNGENTEGLKKKTPLINRFFYENLISRIILFRNLEKIYGAGKNKIGNLRAAVIPYAVSILYNYTDGGTSDIIFDLNLIWIKEELEKDLSDYFYNLMTLINALLKNYASSDDISENSKTRELWIKVSESIEVQNFMGNADTIKILKKYTITKDVNKKRLIKNGQNTEVNFKLIQDNVSLHANGLEFYNKLLSTFQGFSYNDKELIKSITESIYKHVDIDEKTIEGEGNIINKILTESPEIFDEINFKNNDLLSDTFDHIVTLYNNVISKHGDINDTFKKVAQDAKNKNIKDHSVWSKIGELLSKGDAPKILDILQATSLFSNKLAPIAIKPKQEMTELVLLKMLAWSLKNKLLTNKETDYISNFAYGSQKLNTFHEKNLRIYLQTLINHGFVI